MDSFKSRWHAGSWFSALLVTSSVARIFWVMHPQMNSHQTGDLFYLFIYLFLFCFFHPLCCLAIISSSLFNGDIMDTTTSDAEFQESIQPWILHHWPLIFIEYPVLDCNTLLCIATSPQSASVISFLCIWLFKQATSWISQNFSQNVILWWLRFCNSHSQEKRFDNLIKWSYRFFFLSFFFLFALTRQPNRNETHPLLRLLFKTLWHLSLHFVSLYLSSRWVSAQAPRSWWQPLPSVPSRSSSSRVASRGGRAGRRLTHLSGSRRALSFCPRPQQRTVKHCSVFSPPPAAYWPVISLYYVIPVAG